MKRFYAGVRMRLRVIADVPRHVPTSVASACAGGLFHEFFCDGVAAADDVESGCEG